MKLSERRHGERINAREYSKWRETGVAFTWLETEMSEKNLTLTNAIFQHQDQILHHGFLGDQVSAPYIAFGLDCEDKEMLKTQNGVHLKRSTDIMFRNLSRMFWEIEHQTPYCHADEKDSLNLGVMVTELTETIHTSTEFEEPSQKKKKDEDFLKKEPKERDNYTSLPLPNFKVTFFPPSAITDLPHKQKFNNFFDLIWISQNVLKKVSADLFTMVKNGAKVLVENRNYVVSLYKEEFAKTPAEIDSVMKLCSCALVEPFDLNKDGYAKYKYQNKSDGDKCLGNAEELHEIPDERDDVSKNSIDQIVKNVENEEN
ncbi:dynein assembly factor 3, axonemal-like [Nilaparvata lugens]|uniref:dynein assembly factor 3, axonemal-like n=1 Tax=Nilaparvata lugens TaxID=108931 RepID=UPI00193DEEAB|nr:dynein assembly factor 3, axonemal-like [Nilaparvata lugens]